MAKQVRQVELKSEAQRVAVIRPGLVTFGVEKLSSGRFIAVRLEGDTRTSITPARHGQEWGVTKALAWQQVLTEIAAHAKRLDT